MVKSDDVVGLHLDPAERALVLCVDEETQIQALTAATGVPDAARLPGPRHHDYLRHGASSLYAALDLTTGKVIGALHWRYRSQQFVAFVRRIDAEVPADLHVHLVLDNASTPKTPAVRRWLPNLPDVALARGHSWWRSIPNPHRCRAVPRSRSASPAGPVGGASEVT